MGFLQGNAIPKFEERRVRTPNNSPSLTNVCTWRSFATWRLCERCLHENRPSGSSRAGFTLLELVLAMAVMATIAAIAWPHLQPGVSRAAYRSAALQLKSDFAEAREQAIRDGVTHEFRFQPGTGRYVITPANWNARRGEVSKPASKSRPSDRRAVGSTAAANEEIPNAFRELPGDIVFRERVTESDGRQPVDRTFPAASQQRQPADTNAINVPNASKTERLEDVLNSENGGWALSVRFFPDGRATEAAIDLEGPDLQREISVQVRGLTGGVKIGTVLSIDPEGSGMADADTKSQSAAQTSRQP